MSEGLDPQMSLTVGQIRLIDQVFSPLSDDPKKRIDELKAIRRYFAEALCEHLGPAVNDAVRQMPQKTPEDFRKVAAWVNDLLRETDLRVQEPASGLPGLVIADVKSGKDADIPRYRIVVKHRADGKTGYGKVHYKPLFDLSLMPAPTRLEAFAHSFEKRSSRSDVEAGPQR